MTDTQVMHVCAVCECVRVVLSYNTRRGRLSLSGQVSSHPIKSYECSSSCLLKISYIYDVP